MEYNVLTIDIFKNNDLFDRLSKYNYIIELGDHVDLIDKAPYPAWFVPKTQVFNPTVRSYPNVDSISCDPKWKINLTIVNYMVVFLSHVLYQDRKDIIIEDMGCGVGYLFLYLSKLGFRNFSAIENFSHIPKPCFDALIYYVDGNVALNKVDINPHVINTTLNFFSRRITSDGNVFIELCLLPDYDKKIEKDNSLVYVNSNLELFVNFYHRRSSILGDDFKLLCVDSNDMTEAYCRKDKYNEFVEKLTPYKQGA